MRLQVEPTLYDGNGAVSARVRHTDAGPADSALTVAASGFFDTAAAIPAPGVGADMLRWTIEVEQDGRQHSVTLTQGGSPASAAWERLLARILAACAGLRRRGAWPYGAFAYLYCV